MEVKKSTKLIVVNKKDEIVGYENKEKCHQEEGILHRAFTIFIFNKKNQVLIQKRSNFKKLWPLFWETSCSSHPRKGETVLKAAKKRLKKELNFTCRLKPTGKFQYQAPYKNIGSENEICYILVGKYNKEVKSNPKEAADWQWIDFKELRKDVARQPQQYAPWLKIAINNLQVLLDRQ